MTKHSWHHHSEPERDIDDPALGLSCRICGYAPVQAEGSVDGVPFYFRSRHAAWTFTISLRPDVDPAAIDPLQDQPGFFQNGEYRGYYLSGDYGHEPEASYLRYDEAERMIRECVQQYLRAAAEISRPPA